jgi:tubulin polyglutamylase TTLL4
MISKKSRVQKKRDYLISEYVAEPHLINGLKYDLRVYVVVTSYSPLRIYLFEEGLTRFATEKYTNNLSQLTKRYVHLTNYAINKNSKNFFKNKDSHVDNIGNKWSLTAWKKEITNQGKDIDLLMSKIQDVIIKTLISAEPFMLDMHSKSPEHKNNCFELYGFDILIDN